MIKTDIEDEEAESFGLGKVCELNWKNVMDLYACTECGRCEEQCPADMTGKPLSPKRIIHDSKHDLFDQSQIILAGDYDSVAPLVRAESPISPDVLWSCTTCRACEDICPVDIQHLDIILEARKYQVLMESNFPPEMQETFTNFENQSNPWGFGSDTRAHWAKGLDIPLMTDNPEADVLYYVGCAGSFDDRGKKIAQAMARILKKAGVNFAILGEEERCNGDVARRAGNEYLAQMMISENVEILNRYRPKKILTACPHCYNTIKNEYPQFGACYEVVHHSEFLLDLVHQGRLKTNGGFGIEKLTFHDSCYLGRWNGIFEAPRQLLRFSNNDAKLIEMKRSLAEGLCCGAGGARMFMEETIGRRINHERAQEVIATRATQVAAACPFCITMLTDGIADLEGDLAVRDIAEILDEATE
jgi:Fe-S oxidoreductase